MSPSPADFSQITELIEIKRLYEELEERHKVKLNEKDEQIADLEGEIAELQQVVEANSSGADELRQQVEQLQGENQRLREESTQKINTLNDRIRDLNQRLTEAGGGKQQSGFFKR